MSSWITTLSPSSALEIHTAGTTSLAADPRVAASWFDSVGWPVIATVAGAAVGVVLAVLAGHAVRRLLRRWTTVQAAAHTGRIPMCFTLAVLGGEVGLHTTTSPAGWRDSVDHAVTVALIGGFTWLLVVVVIAVAELLLVRFRTDLDGDRQIRRIRTQITVLRRIASVALVVLGAGAALLTFPGARIAGAGVLTSAGLISIVAGLAAQSSLANMFAGIQLAFTDAIRVDDVVVVKDTWGRIDEITLTYVVVRVWDERNLILPSTYFTNTPFENWTRNNPSMLGTVELDLDWSVPVTELRDRTAEILSGTPLWDERVGSVQVTDAVGSFVRVRILVSARDSGTLFDLRCTVREELIHWLQTQHPQALPRVRVQPAPTGPAPRPTGAPGVPAQRTGGADLRKADRDGDLASLLGSG
jgi:small-conductance mechanosensitive channel